MTMLMKALKILLTVVLVVLLVLILGRNTIVPAVAKPVLKAMTGLTLEMDKFEIGLLSTKLDIRGLKILNPKDYDDRVMVDLPRLYVDYDLSDMIGGTIHLTDVKFFLTEVMLVKRADGSSNLDGIMKLAQKKSEKPAAKAEPRAETGKAAPEIVLDLVEIKVGKFVSKSYNAAGKADVNEIKINIDKRYENKSVQAIAADLSQYTFKVLAQMTMNLNLGDMGKALTGTLTSVGDLGLDTAKKTLETGKDVVGNATNVLKDTTKGLSNMIKLPFGNKD